jgi:hypothetical protein
MGTRVGSSHGKARQLRGIAAADEERPNHEESLMQPVSGCDRLRRTTGEWNIQMERWHFIYEADFSGGYSWRWE